MSVFAVFKPLVCFFSQKWKQAASVKLQKMAPQTMMAPWRKSDLRKQQCFNKMWVLVQAVFWEKGWINVHTTESHHMYLSAVRGEQELRTRQCCSKCLCKLTPQQSAPGSLNSHSPEIYFGKIIVWMYCLLLEKNICRGADMWTKSN